MVFRSISLTYSHLQLVYKFVWYDVGRDDKVKAEIERAVAVAQLKTERGLDNLSSAMCTKMERQEGMLRNLYLRN